MVYEVYDLETETHTHKKRKASPWHPDNRIVMGGWKIQGDARCSCMYITDKDDPFNLKIPEHVTLLVGFNLKFDLLWQWNNPELKAFLKRGGKIWCCQYAEYLLGGQDPKYHYVAMNDIAKKYGGTNKVDAVKLLWDEGVQTSDINRDLLTDYLVGTEEEGRDAGDIGNTEKIFLGQVKRAVEMNMVKAIQSRMDGLLAITEMEWNGLKIDVEEAKIQYKDLKARRTKAYAELQNFVPELPEGLEFNWGSRTHKSCLIFGGTVKYKKQDTYIDPKTAELAIKYKTELHYVDEEGNSTGQAPEDYADKVAPLGTVYYKSGKKKGEPKTKKMRIKDGYKTKFQDFFYEFKGHYPPQPEWATKTTDAKGQPLYSTSGDTIDIIAQSGVPFCKTLGEYESLCKEINTYFVTDDGTAGMLTCVDAEDHIIHHNLNNVATVTSRLSSSDPNLQNVPRGDKSNVKKLFKSRFDGGFMLEADYSQLEVVVQGVLSGDKQLCEDLRNKIDFHCKRVAIQPKYNITYDEVKAIIKDEDHPEHSLWKERRTKAKIFSFQRAYGAGAKLIALSTGMPLEDVEQLIEAEDKTYPGVKMFNDSVERSVRSSAKPFRDPARGFRAYSRGFYTAPTGCIYSFRSYDAPDYLQKRGVHETFSPTELKNYPIQGTGGEIVQGICGKLFRHFVETDNYGGRAVLCNTVHDCVWIDCDKTVKDQVVADVKRIMEEVDVWFAQFGVKINVPFPVEVESGPNMLELKHEV